MLEFEGNTFYAQKRAKHGTAIQEYHLLTRLGHSGGHSCAA